MIRIDINGKIRNATPEEEKAFLELNADNRTYEEKVEAFIRTRYTISDELAILRQRDVKPEEFAEYNAFCEECKRNAKKESQ